MIWINVRMVKLCSRTQCPFTLIHSSSGGWELVQVYTKIKRVKSGKIVSFGEIFVPGSSCCWEKHESGADAGEEGTVAKDGSMKLFSFLLLLSLFHNIISLALG